VCCIALSKGLASLETRQIRILRRAGGEWGSRMNLLLLLTTIKKIQSQLLSEQSLILSVPSTAQYIFRGGEFMRPYGPTPWHYTKMQTRTMGGLSSSIWLTINKVKVKWVSLAVSQTIYTSDALTLELDEREHRSKRTWQGSPNVNGKCIWY